MTNFQYLDDFWFELDKKDRIIAQLTEEIARKDKEIEQLERVLKLMETINKNGSNR